MSKTQTVACPFCEGIAIYCTEPMILTRDEVSHAVDRHFYKCDECKEQFTTGDQDLRTLAQVPGSIWEKELEESTP